MKVSGERVDELFDELLKPMAPPKPNTEKIVQMHVKVRPYVPDEFRNDSLYAAPTEAQQDEAKSIKRAREERRKQTAALAPQPDIATDRAAQPKLTKGTKKKVRKQE